tara:strand:+ start:372 stop:779 length:408 start_codon:yes stop_codon:yes gene_type:complete
MSDQVNKRKVGRPKKKDIEAKKAGNRKAVGRPKGDADAIREYKARLLACPKSRKVMDSILNAALDDDHKNQAAAWKLVVDRIMPLSYFDEAKNVGGKAAVNITITGVGGDTTIIGEQEPDIEEGQIVNLNPLESD